MSKSVALVLILTTLIASGRSLNQNSSENSACGVQDVRYIWQSDILNGQDFEKGSWPWMVALMSQKELPAKIFCAGTLISMNRVVTAAHCIQEKNEPEAKQPSDVLQVFGVYDLTKTLEPGTFSQLPSKIVVHQDWNSKVPSYDADIAILMNDKEITMTRFIKPICLWTSSSDPIDMKNGVVAGYGSQNAVTEVIPKMRNVPLYTNDICLPGNPLLAEKSSTRTLCAGSRNRLGPCLGDSGSGLYHEHEGNFFLRALVSSATLDKNQECDLTNYALFTDVLKYTKWINSQASQAKEIIA